MIYRFVRILLTALISIVAAIGYVGSEVLLGLTSAQKLLTRKIEGA